MKLTGVELRRIAMPLVAPFRTSFGTADRRATSCCCASSPTRPRAGASASRWPTRSTPRSTSTRRPTCCAASSSRRWPRPGRSTRTRSRRRSRRSRGTGWPRPRWRWRCSTPSCAPRAGRSARELGAVRDRVPCGVSVGIMDTIPELLDAVGGYLDEGYVRIKLKIEPGWDVEPVRAVRERFGDDVLLQVDANTAYTLRRRPPPRPARPVRPAADRAAARRGGRARPRRPGQADPDADLPRRVDHLGAVPRPPRSGSAPARSSTSSPAGSAATSRRGASTTSASRTACRCGAAACSRPASAGPRTSRSPRCPGFTLPGDTSASGRYYRTDITAPFVLDDGHLAVPTGPGLGVEPLPDRARRGHHRRPSG